MSDMHVHHDDENYAFESNYVQNMSTKDPRLNPVAALHNLIDLKRLRADLLVCCGDITDKAHPGALTHGWEVLNDLQRRLQARAILATAGNHDVDSRFSHSSYDARGAVVQLAPDFPVSDRQLANQYWSRHYCIVRGANFRIVLLNSAAYHGEGRAFPSEGQDAAAQPEYLHGRVSPQTLASLKIDLEAEPAPAVNILICHHHPTRIDTIPGEDYSAMDGGEDLVSMLTAPGIGRWVILHGHRHVAKVHHPGSASINAGAIAFCAGSFGKVLPREWPSNNQFYIVEFLTDPVADVGQSVAGIFNSWSWTRNGAGWTLASADESLPGRGGFGFVGELDPLAQQIGLLVERSPGPVSYAGAVGAIPKLDFVPPGDWAHIRTTLKASGVRVVEDPDDGELMFVKRS